VPHFRIGGSIHLVANNQIAFTAEKHIGRASLNCTDIAKAVDCPVIHVNANSPEVCFVIEIEKSIKILGC
jgi:probable 2-oxoglutarate dehydrogenase E1 component DHKTD1